MPTVTLPIGAVKPNPYRDFSAVPINPATVEALRNSMHETGFWSGLQVRAHAGGHELIFGHTRREAALQEFGPDYPYEFDLIDADEREMIRRMNFENLQEIVQPTLGHLKVGIRAARDQLEALLQKTASVTPGGVTDWAPLVPYFGDMSNAKAAAKDRAVSQYAVAKFLYGNTSRTSSIERVLNQLPLSDWQREKREADLKAAGAIAPEKLEAAKQQLGYDASASEFFQRPAHAEAFRAAVISPEGRKAIPKAAQKGLAKKIATTLKQRPGGTQPKPLGPVADAKTKPEEVLNEANITKVVEDAIKATQGVSAETLKLDRLADRRSKEANGFAVWLADLAADMPELHTLQSDAATGLWQRLAQLQARIAEVSPVIFAQAGDPLDALPAGDVIEGVFNHA